MNNHRTAALLLFATAAALPAQKNTNKTLVINQSSTPAAVIEVDGHAYAEVQSLARMLDASVTFEADRVVLQLPTTAAATSSTSTERLSADFQRSAINALSQMREYKGEVEGVLQVGAPITGTWLQNQEAQAQTALAQAQVSVSTDGDRSALILLQNGFSMLQAWANGAIADRKAMNATRSISENALQKDPALNKLTTCGQAFARMVASGTFADNESCH